MSLSNSLHKKGQDTTRKEKQIWFFFLFPEPTVYFFSDLVELIWIYAENESVAFITWRNWCDPGPELVEQIYNLSTFKVKLGSWWYFTGSLITTTEHAPYGETTVIRISSTDRHSSIVSLGLACHLVTAKTRLRTHSFNCEIISRQFIEHRQLFYHLQYEEYACMQDEFMDEMGAV